MAKRLQHRGGTTSQHSTFTGAVREVTVDTDKNTLVVHDGATAGGHPLATATNFTSTGIDDNATSTAITIDSSERVGIGTTSPQKTFVVSNGGAEGFEISPTDVSATIRQIAYNRSTSSHLAFRYGALQHEFHVSDQEKMRIDSSGRLLVGKTSDDNNSTGCQVEGDGTLSASRNGFAPLILNRQTSDGKIAEFRNDGTEFGNIGSHNGLLIIGGGDTGIKFSSGVDSIFPFDVNTNANRDNAVDFGYSTVRWKDLYVGGGVYLGGTGTANKLDDYEEGTWTPSFNFSELTGFSGSITTADATYTKIGNFVSLNVGFSFPGSSGSLSVGDLCTVSGGLPFTQKGSTYGGTGGNFAFSVSNTANISIQPRSGGFRAFITSIVGSPTRVGGAMRITYNYQTT